MAISGDALLVRDRLIEYFEEFYKGKSFALHTGTPATVVAFKPPHTNQFNEKMPATVDCILGHHRAYEGRDLSGNRTIDESGDYVIPSRPIVFPGFPPAMMQLPDILGKCLIKSWGWLCPNSESFDDMMVRGEPTLPSSRTRHNINHSMFVPGLLPGPTGDMDLELDKVKLGAQDGSWSLAYNLSTKNIDLTTTGPTATVDAGTEVKVGANATDAAANGTRLDALISNLITALASFVPPPPDGGAALAALLQSVLSAAPTMSAVKAKVE